LSQQSTLVSSLGSGGRRLRVQPCPSCLPCFGQLIPLHGLADSSLIYQKSGSYQDWSIPQGFFEAYESSASQHPPEIKKIAIVARVFGVLRM
jgi:hypothetical protein